jgi:hypothetical protein
LHRFLSATVLAMYSGGTREYGTVEEEVRANAMAVTGLARARDGNIVLRPVWRVHEHVEVAVDPECLLNALVRWQLILQDDCMIDPG